MLSSDDENAPQTLHRRNKRVRLTVIVERFYSRMQVIDSSDDDIQNSQREVSKVKGRRKVSKVKDISWL